MVECQAQMLNDLSMMQAIQTRVFFSQTEMIRPLYSLEKRQLHYIIVHTRMSKSNTEMIYNDIEMETNQIEMRITNIQMIKSDIVKWLSRI